MPTSTETQQLLFLNEEMSTKDYKREKTNGGLHTLYNNMTPIYIEGFLGDKEEKFHEEK